MLPGFIFQNKLQAINVLINRFKWEQNKHKILAFVVVCCPKFPKTFQTDGLASTTLFEKNSEWRKNKCVTLSVNMFFKIRACYRKTTLKLIVFNLFIIFFFWIITTANGPRKEFSTIIIITIDSSKYSFFSTCSSDALFTSDVMLKCTSPWSNGSIS